MTVFMKKIKNISEPPSLKKFYRNLKILFKGLKKFDFHASVLIIPVFFALLASIFEGASIGLLIPLFKGVIESNFEFINKIPLLKSIVFSLPPLFDDRNHSIFVYLVGLIATAAVFKNVCHYLSSLAITSCVVKFCATLRQKIYERYLSFGKQFFDKSSMGHLQQILISYANEVGSQLMVVNQSLILFFSLLISLVIMWVISWELTICLLLVFPVLFVSTRSIIKKIKRSSQIFAKLFSSLGRQISNALLCIPLVKAYTNEDKEKERFAQINQGVRRAQFSIGKKHLLIMPLQEVIMVFVFLTLIGLMAFWTVRGGAAQVAGYAVFFILLKRAMTSFGSFNKLLASLARVKGPIAEIKNIFDNQDKFFIKDGNQEFAGLKQKIELNNLTFSYLKEITVLSEISTIIRRGETVAIVGPTGSGKTTLVNLIMRFYNNRLGSIKLDGMNIQNFSLKSFRKHIALVSQEVFLFNDTLRSNLIYGLNRDVRDEEMEEALGKARLIEFISRLPKGLETLVGDRGVRLSGGEKQRLSIARAILKKSEILILDEATSSLDSKTENAIQKAINDTIKDKTAIVIAHRLSTIKHADKIIVLENGRLAEEGGLAELLERKGKFYELWNEQKFY